MQQRTGQLVKPCRPKHKCHLGQLKAYTFYPLHGIACIFTNAANYAEKRNRATGIFEHVEIIQHGGTFVRVDRKDSIPQHAQARCHVAMLLPNSAPKKKDLLVIRKQYSFGVLYFLLLAFVSINEVYLKHVDINTDPPTLSEVKVAIKAMKSGKAGGHC